MQEIHNRQPVIIKPEDMEAWLTDDNPEKINQCMTPLPAGSFEVKTISDYVNNARNEGPECLTESDSASE